MFDVIITPHNIGHCSPMPLHCQPFIARRHTPAIAADDTPRHATTIESLPLAQRLRLTCKDILGCH